MVDNGFLQELARPLDFGQDLLDALRLVRSSHHPRVVGAVLESVGIVEVVAGGGLVGKLHLLVGGCLLPRRRGVHGWYKLS